MISPIILQMIIHYCVCCDDFREGDLSAPAVRDGLAILIAEKMLSVNDKQGNPKYRATDKAKYYLNYICQTPFPIMIYKIPERVEG